MSACLLVLLRIGAKWVPLVAVPGVLAGMVASVCLIVSGIKGVAIGPSHLKRRRPASADRVVQWIANRPDANGDHHKRAAS